MAVHDPPYERQLSKYERVCIETEKNVKMKGKNAYQQGFDIKICCGGD